MGIWDDQAKEWLDEYYYQYDDPFITLDGGSIYIHNRIQVSQLLRLIKYANRERRTHLALNAGMYELDNDNQTGVWGEYDVSGFDDALAYLDCFAGVR